MTIRPFSAGGYSADQSISRLTTLKAGMTTLQAQLATDRKATSYAGLGDQRGVALDLRAKQAGTQQTLAQLKQTETRLNVMNTSLDALSRIGRDTASVTRYTPFKPDQTLRTQIQLTTEADLAFALDVLNSDLNGSALFGGQETAGDPVLPLATLLDGDGAGNAGARAVIAERRAADGATGNPALAGGRVALAGRLFGDNGAVATTIQFDQEQPAIAQPGEARPRQTFGLSFAQISGTLSNATLSGPAGPGNSIGIALTGQPAEGESLTVTLVLPDESTETITLLARGATAASQTVPSFQIGATAADTATNLRAALTAELAAKAAGALDAASAIEGAEAFFKGSNSNPVQRVAGPPATATALTAAGTPTATVIWYRGEDGALPARQTATARLDQNLTVNTGARANEQGIQRLLAGLTAFATAQFQAADAVRYQEYADRARALAGHQPGLQHVEDIQTELALTMTTVKKVQERTKTRDSTLAGWLQDIEGVNREEVSVKLLSLQTRLEASYQTTSILSRLNLTDFLR
jgi:hypothetical protein